METVVAQRSLPAPITEQTLHALQEQFRECCAQNRVRAVESHLSLDGLRTICVFESPDAEAVRRVSRQAQMPGSVWTAEVHLPESGAAAGSELIVVERSFAAPADFEPLEELEKRGAWCLDQHRVCFVRSYLALDRQRMICLYTAPDAESVRSAQKQIGIPLDDAWPARRISY